MESPARDRSSSSGTGPVSSVARRAMATRLRLASTVLLIAAAAAFPGSGAAGRPKLTRASSAYSGTGAGEGSFARGARHVGPASAASRAARRAASATGRKSVNRANDYSFDEVAKIRHERKPRSEARPVEELLDDIESLSPAAALKEGQQVLVQVTEASPLGLNLRMLPFGATGLVYTDEAAYPPSGCVHMGPALTGDVLQAHVLKLRDDGRVDFCFRPIEKLTKLREAMIILLDALFEARAAGETLPLGDASKPNAVRARLSGLSKASFKAARGQLLKQQLLAQPLLPQSTSLAAGVEWPSRLPRPPTGTRVWLRALPPRVAGTSGAKAVFDLLSTFGEVICIRGFPTGDEGGREPDWLCAIMADERSAETAIGSDLLSSSPAACSDADAAALGARCASGFAAGDFLSSAEVYVGNLPAYMSEGMLRELFEDCGRIEEVALSERVAEGRGASGSFAHVSFVSAEAASRAMRLSGLEVDGYRLRVEMVKGELASNDARAFQKPQPVGARVGRGRAAVEREQPSSRRKTFEDETDFDDGLGMRIGEARTYARGGEEIGYAGDEIGYAGGDVGYARESRKADIAVERSEVAKNDVVQHEKSEEDMEKAAEAAGLLSLGEIVEMVAERERLRAKRAYADSDRARDVLCAMGVAIDDGQRAWRCVESGRTGPIPDEWALGGGDTTQVEKERPLADGLLYKKEIGEMLLRREGFRQRRMFDEADAVLEDLFAGGVTVDFRSGEWHCLETRRKGLVPGTPRARNAERSARPAQGGGSRQQSNRPSGRRGAKEPLSEEEIESQLVLREEMRKNRDFEAADAVRDALWDLDVKVDDRIREWSCRLTGRSGPLPKRSRN